MLSPVVGAGSAVGFSTLGVRVEYATDEVEPGDRLDLNFSLFVGSYATVFHGRVVWAKGDAFGVEFVDLEPHHLRTLELVMRRHRYG